MTIGTGRQPPRTPSVRRSPEPVERALREGLIGSRVEEFQITRPWRMMGASSSDAIWFGSR